MNWCKIVIRIGWEIFDQLMLAGGALPVETACALPNGSLEGISGHLKGVLKSHWKEKNASFCLRQIRKNLKELCRNSNLQFLIWYLREIMFFSKIFVEIWIYTNQWEKLAISTERLSVNKMSFLSRVSLNFVENSIVCAKFGSTHKFTSCPRKWWRLLAGGATCSTSFTPELISNTKHQLMACGWIQAGHWSPSWPQVNSSVHWIGPRVHSLPVTRLGLGQSGLSLGHPRPQPWPPWAWAWAYPGCLARQPQSFTSR